MAPLLPLVLLGCRELSPDELQANPTCVAVAQLVGVLVASFASGLTGAALTRLRRPLPALLEPPPPAEPATASTRSPEEEGSSLAVIGARQALFDHRLSRTEAENERLEQRITRLELRR